MNIYNYKAVFFDLDGTLLDSAKDLSFAVDVMAETLGLKKPNLESIKQWIGNGTVKLVERSLSYSIGSKPSQPDIDAAFILFSKAYRDCIGEYSTLFPGAKDLLVKLLASNIKVACITNKPLEFTEFLLQQNMISQFFSVICAGDNVKFKKPNPWPLLYTAKTLKIDINECLMIGDSMHDVSAARKADCDVCAVTYGYNHGENIKNSNPNFLIDSLIEIQ